MSFFKNMVCTTGYIAAKYSKLLNKWTWHSDKNFIFAGLNQGRSWLRIRKEAVKTKEKERMKRRALR
ncbi:MAG: hypothetical protein KDD04_11170, partial [Sinomicrobium sp.]|nr:hypothetical protein [Sinomicrobium sp.]